MEEYLKAGVQTNESEEILFIGWQEEVGDEGGGRGGDVGGRTRSDKGD